MVESGQQVLVAGLEGTAFDGDVVPEGGGGVGAEPALDGPRFDEADVDAGAFQFQAQGVGEAFDGEFGAVVGAAHRQGGEAEDGAVLDDAAFAVAAHGGEDADGEVVPAEHQGLELLPQHVPFQVFDGAGLAVTAVVEQGVDFSVGAGQHRFRRLFHLFRAVQIQGQGFDVCYGVQLGQIAVFAGRGEDPVTTLGQAFGAASADTGGAAGDQDTALVHGDAPVGVVGRFFIDHLTEKPIRDGYTRAVFPVRGLEVLSARQLMKEYTRSIPCRFMNIVAAPVGAKTK